VNYDFYTWYGIENGLISTDTYINITSEDFYYLITSIAHCQVYSDTVFINLIEPYQDQQICVVSVDPETEKNKIQWSINPDVFIEYCNIYKEIGTDVYNLLSKVKIDSSNFYIDTESNPLEANERYRMSISDVCGNESQLSDPHKTIYLQASLGLNKVVNLAWSPYEGFEYTQIHILRGISYDSMEVLATRPANNNIFTDINPIPGESVYIIEAIADYSCTGSEGTRTSTPNAYTMSNLVHIENVTGIDDDLNQMVKIYPNPNTGIYNLNVPERMLWKQFIVVNLIGEIVYKNSIDSNNMEIDLSSQPAGQYIMIFEEPGGYFKVLKK
jgi:hypothetical protein